jgi:hypothetical protein
VATVSGAGNRYILDMEAIGDASEGPAWRKLVDVPAAQVRAGDWVRDRGIFRNIDRIDDSAAERAIVLHFEPVAGYGDQLSVPHSETISVWRPCRPGP